MQAHHHARALFVVTTLVAASGCGAVKSAAGVAPPIKNDTFEAVLAHGDFGNRKDSLECLALRGKVDASRNLFEGSSEMDAVEKTDPWKAFEQAYDAFKQANCPAITTDHDNISDTCAHLGEDVAKAWNDLQDAPAWQVAHNNSDLQDLVSQWKEAKSIDCYQH